MLFSQFLIAVSRLRIIVGSTIGSVPLLLLRRRLDVGGCQGKAVVTPPALTGKVEDPCLLVSHHETGTKCTASEGFLVDSALSELTDERGVLAQRIGQQRRQLVVDRRGRTVVGARSRRVCHRNQ